MLIGLPKEVKDNEYRVAITPGGVKQLVDAGHQVLVQVGAGAESGFADEAYKAVGAKLVPTASDAWSAELVVKVKEPQRSEYPLMRPGLGVFTYLHLAAEKHLTIQLMERRVTGIAYETVEKPDGTLPLLTPMSEVAGRPAIRCNLGQGRKCLCRQDHLSGCGRQSRNRVHTSRRIDSRGHLGGT